MITNKIIVASIINHFMFYLNISWHKLGTLLRLKGNFTHVTIGIAYSIPIFFGTLIGAFFVPVNLSLTVANTYTVRTAYFP